MTETKPRVALVIGASGGLGSALVSQWQADTHIDRVIAVSRHSTGSEALSGDDLQWMQSDYSETSVEQISHELASMDGHITRVCICNGILHSDKLWPEKRIEDVQADALHQVMHANAVIPLLWVRALLPVVRGKHSCVMTAFSARIGSIGDNRLGGWYAYRSSKAALNMMLKTAAIEYARRAKNVKLMVFHPGTTDTDLSRPFQGSVADGDLLTADYVADHLVAIMNRQQADGELSFVDWNNEAIAW